jgi:hypothetical protein
MDEHDSALGEMAIPREWFEEFKVAARRLDDASFRAFDTMAD